MSSRYDYLIVGAGSAGCVLASRLSEDPDKRVLLLEAGSTDRHPYIHMPKGFGRLLAKPDYNWYYPVVATEGHSEMWLRGKVLGGSSSVNGMMYTHGHPEDYDDWDAAGAHGWNWDSMLGSYLAIERHGLGAAERRGGDGPLRVTIPDSGKDEVCEAIIAAGSSLGLPVKRDINSPGQEGIGYIPQTIWRGRRSSAARAFLHPARRRPNLETLTRARVERVLFDDQRRAIGVRCTMADGSSVDVMADEVILAAGALESPRLLQCSGVGPGDLLASLGIPVVHDSPNVGRNLREHRLLTTQYRLRNAAGNNRRLRGAGLIGSVLRYCFTRGGVLATGAYDVAAFVRSRPGLERPDIQINLAPYSTDPRAKGLVMEREPGMRAITYVMRPTSQGTLRITSSDVSAPLDIRPCYLSTEEDRATSVAAQQYVRKLFATSPLDRFVERETTPGPGVRTDQEIVDAFLRRGGAGMHAAGTCKMGSGVDAVVDPALRVLGVERLRVVDCSVMPTQISGNTNAPVMAIAWRAADLIRKDATRR